MSERGLKLDTKNKVQQNFKDECKVGNIVARYIRTGVPPTLGKQPMYLDLSQVGDFNEMLNHVTRVQQEFMKLPAKTRSEFKNQPGEMLNFLNALEDAESAKKALELELISKEEYQMIVEKTSAPEASQAGSVEEPEKSTKDPSGEGTETKKEE